MQVELGDDATYLVAGVGSISFQMPSGDILELTSVLYVLGLTKNLLSVSVMIDLDIWLSLMINKSSSKEMLGSWLGVGQRCS
jgi:hypothetical protein